MVSIHAPRVGCDQTLISSATTGGCFNSRTPCGVRLIPNMIKDIVYSFNSRTPCGVRLSDIASDANLTVFQFTHPVWGATSQG